MLPGIDGLEVTRHLKKNDQTSGIPIVMVTAKGEESDVVTGLGLAIVKHIIHYHNGQITVSSVKGKGTTYHIRLPSQA